MTASKMPILTVARRGTSKSNMRFSKICCSSLVIFLSGSTPVRKTFTCRSTVSIDCPETAFSTETVGLGAGVGLTGGTCPGNTMNGGAAVACDPN